MQEELILQKHVLVPAWPGPQDYNEAVQNPGRNFIDPELASGQAETDRLGLPKPTSGMFASVYKMQCSGANWAVRCFLHSKQDQVQRYGEIQRTLRQIKLPCMVGFEFQEQGIRVDHRILPMLKMEWCQGESLNRWLQRNLRNKEALENLLESFRETLMSLSQVGIAHGDLQHGNILIVDGKIKLVDYDGMYLEQFQGMQSNELGHPNYQHPRRNANHFGPYLDNFSSWLIYLSILISGCDPHVWYDFDGGDECLLFRRDDLEDPMHSELFHVLEHHYNPQIREASKTLRYLLTLELENVPDLGAPIAIPESLPELDAVISDLPDWVNPDQLDPAQTGEYPQINAGKPLLKRKRQRGVPLPPSQKEGSVSGRWKYDENGLVFNPETATHAASQSGAQFGTQSGSASTQPMHSPLLETYTNSRAPYRNVGGTLHSPILDSLSSEDYPDRLGDWTFNDLKPLLQPMVTIPILFLIIFVGVIVPNFPVLDQWPEGEYHRLREGLKFEANGELDRAKKSYEDGLRELANSKDPRADMSRLRLYYNDGRLENTIDQPILAEMNLRQAGKIMERQEGGLYSTEYAIILTDLAKACEMQNKLGDAEQALKKALEIYLQNGYDQPSNEIQSIVESLINILRTENKLDEVARYQTMLTTDAVQTQQTNPPPRAPQPEPPSNITEKAKKLIPKKRK